MSFPAFSRPINQYFECIKVAQGTGNLNVPDNLLLKKYTPIQTCLEYIATPALVPGLIFLATLITFITSREDVILNLKCFQDLYVIEYFL